MIYENLHAILATRVDGLIGDGDKIPWHHSGDLKHFKAVTMDSALIIGFKTLAGIAKNYFKNGKVVLPGRRLYVAYEDRGQSFDEVFAALSTYGNFNKDNVFQLSLDKLSDIMASENKVFVAGGAVTYQKFLPFVSSVYMTLITQKEQSEYTNPVYLTDDFQQLLFNRDPVGISLIKPSEYENDVIADYFHINRLEHVQVGDGTFTEF